MDPGSHGPPPRVPTIPDDGAAPVRVKRPHAPTVDREDLDGPDVAGRERSSLDANISPARIREHAEILNARERRLDDRRRLARSDRVHQIQGRAVVKAEVGLPAAVHREGRVAALIVEARRGVERARELFYTTKPTALGLGIPFARKIIERPASQPAKPCGFGARPGGAAI